MKAEDLRLNNWVEIKDQEVKTYAQVEGIGNLQHVAGQLWSIEELEPIPLTEEWLTRFGFNDDGFKQYEFINWGIKVKKDPHAISESNWIVFHGFMNQFSELVSLKHVHQLQNLYFALTGEELQTDENDQKVNQ
jgi:hypothetical protein